MAEVHAPHVIPSTLSVVVAMCAVAVAEGAIVTGRCSGISPGSKVIETADGGYNAVSEKPGARLVRCGEMRKKVAFDCDNVAEADLAESARGRTTTNANKNKKRSPASGGVRRSGY